jgi:hypothetical protein
MAATAQRISHSSSRRQERAMSAFAFALDALFTDPHISREAVYVAEGNAPLVARVVTRRADAVRDFGGGRI